MRLRIEIVVAAILAWQMVAALPAGAAAAAQEYSEEGAKACLDCHETESVMGIMKTAHNKVDDPKTPAATRECQSCHGPSAKHMMFPMQVENVHFGRKSTSPPEVQNKLCLECHRNGQRENWKAGAHGFENVICSTCHSIHDPKKVVRTQLDETATCTSSGCHDNMMKKAAPGQFSHALGKDLNGMGELTCSGCHNPHGPLTSARCIECHVQTPQGLANQSKKAKRVHEEAAASGTDCIRCHQGIAHPI